MEPTIRYPNGGHYVGELNATGKRHGYGRMIYGAGDLLFGTAAAGDVYEGDWRQDLWQGFGTLRRVKGVVIKGHFAKGQIEGKAQFSTADNNFFFEGEHKRSLKHGRGSCRWGDGFSYDGEFKEGKRHGKGRFGFADGGTYVGAFKDDQFHGKGIFTSAQGEKYEGTFVAGAMHGDMKVTTEHVRDAVHRYKQGEFVEYVKPGRPVLPS